MKEFLIELYVSCAESEGVERRAERVRRAAVEVTAAGTPVRFVRSIFVPADETCLLLFEAESVEASPGRTARGAAVRPRRRDRALTTDRRHHMKRFLVLATLAALAVSLAGVAQAGPAEPTAPAKVAVPEGHKLFLVGHASGFQVYECTATGWRFAGPLANLYDENGKLLATHFGGPSWQAGDGSKVTATLDGDAAITVDPTAIAWLRLRVTSATPGADGDRLVATTYIQRLETAGGLAPASEACHAGTVGEVVRVPYTAVYAFWKATGN